MATAILTETLPGVPSGMNLALPQHELDDTEARYLQDALVDKPGILRMRGPVQQVASIATLTRPATGLVMALNPLGAARYAVLNGNASNGYFSPLVDATTSVATDIAWPHILPTTPSTGAPYRIVDSKPALDGGVFVGVTSAYDNNSPNQALALWYGGNKATVTGTISLTRGSKTVTGSGTTFTTNVAPGMWLFSPTDDPYTNPLIGCVASIQSNTSLTLIDPSPYNATSKTGTFQALRGFAPKVVKGTITCDTNGTTVNGGDTKFLSQGLNSGSWNLYRASDMAWVGSVTTVASEFSLTLAANAAVACADDEFVALRADSDWTLPITSGSTVKTGVLTAVYADRQWYADPGSSTVWFSDVSDPEAVDLSSFDGDWFKVSSSATTNEPIQALVAAYNALIVLKQNETWAIFGSTATQFTPKKLEDDGTLSGMTVQSFGGGVIWAGREGIHFYDGVETRNLVADKLGDYWKTLSRSFDPTTYRAWSMIDRDHYILFLESVTPSVSVTKGSTVSTPTKLTVVINLLTRAVTLWSNVDIRGGIVLPAAVGKKTWYIVNGGLSAPTGVTKTGSSSGGSLATNTYYYKVTAIDYMGYESAASSEVSQAITGPTGSVALSWTAVTGAASYRIYRGTSAAGENVYYTSTTNSYTDTGAASTGGTPPAADATARGYICDGDTLFTGAGRDSVVCTGSSAKGPDFYWESRKFDAGDALRLKRYRWIALDYMAAGDAVAIDQVLGLNNTGTTLASTLPISLYTWDTLKAGVATWNGLAALYSTWQSVNSTSIFNPLKVLVNAKSQFFAFRLYGQTNALTQAQIGPYQVAYKIERAGRMT